MSAVAHILMLLVDRCNQSRKPADVMIIDVDTMPIVRTLYFRQDDRVYNLVFLIQDLIGENQLLKEKLRELEK